MLLPDGHVDKSRLMLEALALSQKSQRLERVVELGRRAEESGEAAKAQSFAAAQDADVKEKKEGGSRFGQKPMGKIVEIGQAPTSGRGDYISYYTARFGNGKKKVDEGKQGDHDTFSIESRAAQMEDAEDNSDSEDEEEFEATIKREKKYQQAHAHTHNIRQMQRKSGDSQTKGKLAHSTSRVTLPKSISDARRLKNRFGLTSGQADYDLFKKDQESKAAYSVCKYTEPM